MTRSFFIYWFVFCDFIPLIYHSPRARLLQPTWSNIDDWRCLKPTKFGRLDFLKSVSICTTDRKVLHRKRYDLTLIFKRKEKWKRTFVMAFNPIQTGGTRKSWMTSKSFKLWAPESTTYYHFKIVVTRTSKWQTKFDSHVFQNSR